MINNGFLSDDALDTARYNEFYQRFINAVTCNGKDMEAAKQTRAIDCYYVDAQLGLNKKHDALELGAAFSLNYIYFASRARRLVVSDNLSWYDRTFAREAGIGAQDWFNVITKTPHTAAQKIDARHIQHADNTFDRIYSVSFIEHVDDDAACMKEIYRVLKQGGVYVFTTECNPYVGMPYNPDIYFRVYTPDELIRLALAAGFEIDGEIYIPDDAAFVNRMSAAVDNPALLTLPSQHFGSFGMRLLKR